MSDEFDFSIIIPTYNRPLALAHCLNGIAALETASRRAQVIVVNDGGAPPERASIELLQTRFSFLLCAQSNQGPSAARNHGAQRARGKYLVFTDDDCVPARDWLAQLEHALKENTLVGGSVSNGVRGNACAEASQLLFEFLYECYYNRAVRVTQKPFFTSNNFALAKRAFDAVGGFLPEMRFAEDRELSARLAAAGCSLVYAPAARVIHFRELNLRSFWRQHFSYGQGAYLYHHKLFARGEHRIQLESAHFYRALLAYPWRAPRERNAPLLSLLILFSQVANGAGFVAAARNARALQTNGLPTRAGFPTE